LPLTGKVKVRDANGRTAIREVAEGAYVELLGRHGTFRAVVEPKRETALVGAIVLEDFDLLVDCPHKRVIPRDPKIEVQEDSISARAGRCGPVECGSLTTG
jgi:hypothetical protein